MTALAEALLAAQRQAIGALSKAYVASGEDGDYRAEKLEYALNAMGCTDKIEQAQLLSALDILREHGAQVPATNGATKPDAANEPASQKQLDYIAKLADEKGTTAPVGPLTKARASDAIAELLNGTYDPDKWTAPF